MTLTWSRTWDKSPNSHKQPTLQLHILEHCVTENTIKKISKYGEQVKTTAIPEENVDVFGVFFNI